jgi:hypothetical protein
MCFLRAKPIGLMPMLDQGEQDDKVSSERVVFMTMGCWSLYGMHAAISCSR